MSSILNEDIIRSIARQEITNELKSNKFKLNNTKKIKNEKKPNKWNLFLKDGCSVDKKDVSMGERASLCSEEYKLIKDKLIVDENGLRTIE